MGTQQILLIVLSVIIVGVAIAVGITMFSNQAYNANQQAVSGELQNYASQVIQFYKTPTSQGGAGQDSTNVSTTNVATFIGFTGTSSSLTTDNGEFRVTGASGNTVTLKGLGKELKSAKYPLVTTTVSLAAGTISSTVSSGTGF
jgi:hypothetical protein